MNKLMQRYGGIVLLYGMIILGIILLNARFRYLNNQNVPSKMVESIVAIQE